MKRQTLRILMAFGAIALLTVPGTYAELLNGVVAEVPFDFTVGTERFAAGEYWIKLAAAPTVVEIRNMLHRSSKLSLTNAVKTLQPAGEGKLIFHRYGNRYFLSQIWAPGAEYGREFPKSKAELEMARNGLERQTVLVAARTR